MFLRIGTSLTICFAVLIGSGLGLNKGMVLCIDSDGHFALESAHEQHLRSHEEITDHLPHEFPAHGEHGELHAAMEGCFDATVGSVHLRSAAPPSLCPTDFPAAPHLISPNPDLQSSLIGDWRRADSASGAIPRPEIACLSAIILLV
jgi:hypothetical protein